MAYTYSKLASTTVGAGGTSAITFSNIPQNYTDLVLKVSVRGSYSGGGTADILISYNNSSTGYTDRALSGSGSTATSETNGGGGVAIYPGQLINATWTANTFGSIDFYIPNYSGSTNKLSSSDAVTENNATLAFSKMVSGLWSNTAAINRVTIAPGAGTFVQYSTATLYGIRVEL